jgi:hypothetical protein
MTWIVSRIHKRVRKAQMERWRVGKEDQALTNRTLESQGSNYGNQFPNSPLHEPTTQYSQPF